MIKMINLLVVVLAIVLLVPGFLRAADLKLAPGCDYPEEGYESFKIREMSFRNDKGNLSIRVYARNKEAKAGIRWDPREWSSKPKVKIIKEELPADVVIRFDKGETAEALTLYSTLSSLFHGSRLDAVRICGGSVDTRMNEVISLTHLWGKDGSMRFW